jgi:hypothetical protein
MENTQSSSLDKPNLNRIGDVCRALQFTNSSHTHHLTQSSTSPRGRWEEGRCLPVACWSEGATAPSWLTGKAGQDMRRGGVGECSFSFCVTEGEKPSEAKGLQDPRGGLRIGSWGLVFGPHLFFLNYS